MAESADWYNSKLLAVTGSNLNMTRTPDCHFAAEARHNGSKMWVFAPDFNQVAKYADEWISINAGQDGAWWMAVNHVLLKEFHHDKPEPYFLDYTKRYTDAPFLVELREQFVFRNRALGPFAWAYWTIVSCNVLVPQLLWFRGVRRRSGIVFVLSLLINVGMWFERFVIIVTSLHRDFLPSSWASYRPTVVEVSTLAGSFGLFFTCFLIFCRILPVIAMGEVKAVLRHGEGKGGHA